MRALIIRKKNKITRFLVELDTDELIEEVAVLVANGKSSEAVAVVIAKGQIEGEISESDVKKVKADIIIQEEDGGI
jgi:hypothetical protein